MSFIAFEEVKQTETQHYLWVEKYRPNTLENYIGNQQLKDTVKGYIEKHDIPHLLFYGTAGTGKTTLAKAITKNIDCDVMYINASDENSVENVRTKIKSFASSVGFRKIKVIILDEADFLSPEAQAALRNMMETYSLTTRFILTCNYVEKIIPALVSRCQTYKIEPLSKKEVAVHLKNILDKEIKSLRLDPFLETADTDLNNNTWPKELQPTKYQLFKQQTVRENPMQRQKRLEELNKQ
jgi:DNA polymerase III delta prime subunit